MVKQYLSMYGVGTRVHTPDGTGIVRAIYDYKALVYLDEEFRLKANNDLPPERLPFPTEYWNHESPFDFHGGLYRFDELILILRPWNSLRPEEIENLEWDNQSMYWAKKSKKGVITYDQECPHTLRANEYFFFIQLKIDVFELVKKRIALNK